MTGLIGSPLVWAVPGVADLRDRSLPRGLEPEVVARLLASCDRRRTVGRRDYAILLLLVRLGLRAGEVAAIELEDVDWRRGEILIRGKRDRHDRLPLPVDVGEALVSYLRRRGPSECPGAVLEGQRAARVRSVVMRSVGWSRTRARALGCRASVRTACGTRQRPRCSARARRLPEIAQVLRHREIKTTAIYAKVDRARLRALARPWPGARP